MNGSEPQLGPVWMLRINPKAQRRLADPELSDLIERLTGLETATSALATEASDDLFALVPTVPEAVRGRLLALRRNIHNDRPCPDHAFADLPVELPPSVARWAAHQGLRLSCHGEIRTAYDRALDRERCSLRDELGDQNFLTTLAQSAPGVYRDACRYRSRSSVDVKDRKAERALVQYLTRAMVRTSPYGRFTAVGLAEPHPSGAALDTATSDSATSQVEVDRAVFDYLMGGLVKGSNEADPLVALPPTAQVSDARITFFQMRANAMRQLSAPMTGHTRLVVELLALGPRRRSAVAALMAARLGIELPTAGQLLDRALQVGLVASVWRGDEFDAEPVEAGQRDLGPDAGQPVAAALRQLHDDLGRLGHAELHDAGTTVRRALAAGAGELSRLAERPATLAIHEDYVLDPLVVDPSAYEPALDDLAAVTGFLSAFDRMHVVRALLAATLVARFGPGCGVPLVTHGEELVRAVYRSERQFLEQPDADVGPADGSLRMLAKLRQEAVDAIGHGLLSSPSAEIHWSPEELGELVASVPDRFRSDPVSYGLVVQPDGGDLIVNDAYAGHGPMVSRFLAGDQARGGDAIARLRSRLPAFYGPGVRLVEDRGTYGRSINAHPAVLDVGADPQCWSRLRLHHNIATDTVEIVDDDGSPVKVLALGAQLPELLPYPVRLATWLCSSGRVLLDLPGRLGRPADGDETVAYPRIRVGRVIISRRRWYLGADFPVPAVGGLDADSLLALTRWRATYGVPPEVMLKSAFDGPTAWEALSADGSQEMFMELRRQSKPQYVDLASALMVRLLPRLMQRRPPGYIEEVRPTMSEGGHALEWMVEMARPTGASLFDWRRA